ncbi:MAG TPA: hypothetical protein VL484_09275 [Vicinamibacterales bacterium]|jgi:hypothetical protein|nr:hypothetical protein [Vicinamibacterales bacterium]
MRKTSFLLLLAVALAAPASAQSKTSGKVHCAKADPDYAIQVADHDGHSLTLNKAECTWSDSMAVAGLTAKSGEDFTSGEMNGAMGHNTGYHVATMDNGDKMVVRYTGTVTAAKDKPPMFEGKWTYVSGTGKLKGIKGGGTYKGSANADGSSDVTVEGTYTLAEMAAGTKK